MGINRNIVECKFFQSRSSLPYAGFCINRNIVECKCSFRRILLLCCPVLIETLWNVNTRSGSGPPTRCMVLIETLWNVNIVSQQIIGRWIPVLIETLWNVNQVVLLAVIFVCSVLIETLWNVNINYFKNSKNLDYVLIET